MKNSKYSSILKEMKNLLRGDTKSCLAIELIDEKLVALFNKEQGNNDGVNHQEFPLPKGANPSKDEYYIYSDGACRGNPGPGSWGTMIQNSQGTLIYEGSGVKNVTTNNQMELEGAIKGLEFLIKYNNDFDKDLNKAGIKLFSDSKYVIDGLKSWLAGWKKRGWKKADKKAPENLDYWKRIDLLRSQFCHIEYNWVKGHAGHAQNEYCDKLANIALDREGF